MKTRNLQPNTPAWDKFRSTHNTASEAPAMMAVSKYKSRSDLLKEKATGITPEVDPVTQKRFDKGHEYEAIARPWAEKIIGEELYPATGTPDADLGTPLSASLDGITMMEDVIWEHKTLNAQLAEEIPAGIVAPMYAVQMEQQLMVSGAKKCLFMASNGTEESMVHCWYEPDLQLRGDILLGWKQFDIDLANYQHVEEAPEAVAVPVENLPALLIDLVGDVKDSNLITYRHAVSSRIRSINTDLQTDQDFVDAQETVKFLKRAEDEVKAAKKAALAKTASIENLFNAVDELAEEMRVKRLELDKLVKQRKETIRIEIRGNAQAALRSHIDMINDTLMGVRLPEYMADFAGAMKGKRTISSLRDAVDTELAKAKIDISQMADEIRANLKTLNDLDQAGDYRFLFNDIKQIISKPNDDFTALAKLRINEHVQAEVKRLEQERERIRMEEEEKAKRKAEAEQAEARRLEEQQTAQEEQAPEEQSNCPATQKAVQPGPRSTPEPTDKTYSTPQPTSQIAAINNAALDSFVAAGLSAESAKLAVTAIAQGKVAHVSINYQQQVA